MRRSEKILFEIDKRKYKADCPFDYEDGFKRGVEWADKNPKDGMVNKQKFIEKACEWLWNEIYERIDDSEIRESLYDDNYRANLVDAFREAMKE